MDLKTSQTQYTISLDAIDLNFIPTISKYNGHEVTQIWTKKNLTRRDNEYYEFEIMDENEDGGIANQNALTPCYICNTDIPKIFFRDHLNSNKHKIFKKVINASLDRMKKLVSNEIVYEGKRKDESIYFCESCVTVVSTQEKNSHENSARHRKSLAVDKILNDFLDIYTDNKKFSEGTEEGSNIRNCKNYNTLVRNNSKPSENNANNTPCNQSINNKIKESTYTNNSSQNQCDTLSEEKKTVALPVKNDNLKCFPVKEDGQKNEEVPILPCQVVLQRIGTHIKDNSFTCAICNRSVPNHNYNIYTHLTTAKHINNATKQAKEELIGIHYHMDLTKFPQLECFVCKKSLALDNTNVTTHILGSSHQKNYKLMLNNNKIILKNGKYTCNVCHVVIDPMHEIIHCQTSSHLGKLPLCEIAKDTTSSNISQKDHKIRRYLLENDLKQQLCLVCNVKVPKDINNVDSHLTGRVHNEKYNTILRENKIRAQGNNFKCELCDVILPTGSEIQHIHTATHRANAVVNDTKEAPSISTSSTRISTEDNKLRTYLLKNVDLEKKVCPLCNVHVPNNTNNIMSHLTGRVHNEKYNTELSENKIRSQGNNFKCELCDVIIPTGGEIQHIHTATHRANAVVNDTKEAPSISTSSTNISTEDNKLRTYLLKNVDLEKKVCPLCNVHVPNNTNNIMSHLTGRVHNEKYNTELSENKIRSQGNNFKCELCDVIVPTGGEIQHIHTATHRANAVIMKVVRAPSTSSSGISTENNKLRTYLLRNVDSEKKLCLVCNVHVPNNTNNIISHLTGNVHYEKYSTKLIENKIRSQANNFKCELCDVIVPTGGEIQHIHTATHHANAVVNDTKEPPSTSTSSTSISTDDDELRTYLLKNVDSENKLCLVCNIHVQKYSNNIISHLSDAHHNKKYKKIIKKNNMYPQDDDYKCELCDVIVPTGSEIQHIMSEPHKTGITIKNHCVLC